MDNNDLLRRIRYTFDLNDAQMLEVFSLAENPVTRAQISDWLKKDDDESFCKLSDRHLAVFLNGFIVLKRGRAEGPIPEPEDSLNNNLILRKLKIALNLRDEGLLQVFKLAGTHLSKHELSAFFRKPGHMHYRVCKDQYLRHFMQGLQIKFRPRVRKGIT